MRISWWVKNDFINPKTNKHNPDCRFGIVDIQEQGKEQHDCNHPVHIISNYIHLKLHPMIA